MKLSIVTTMYYSGNYLLEFYNRMMLVLQQLKMGYEFVFVDDGSPDNSLFTALQLQNGDSNIKIIELSRNFGHQRAIMTGLQYATGDYIFLIDCDLEENPELLGDFWQRITGQNKIDVVYGVQIKRKGGWFERASGRFFYKILSALSPVHYPADSLTARIMSRHYVDSLMKFQEKELDLWGIFALAGFNQLAVPVTKGHKGISTYTLRKKMKRALEIITSFSHRPLYLTFFLGIFSFGIAVINICIITYKKIVLNVEVEGWASILASIWLIGGLIFLVLGIFGIYLSKMFLEIKNRPLTVIRNVFIK
ncbi:MAG TPA: glycosyltransferase family 2 protein [Cyclobacteriaceae bacterium]|nr:glycosyltransferase family 2 protein [Cyclobacteriaceae bacterium]